MLDIFPPLAIMTAGLAVGLLAGFVKGVVGFALPVVLMSGLATLVSPELALAGLVVPSVLLNLLQGLRQGPRAAFTSVRRFGRLLAVGFVVLILSAQLVPRLSEAALFAALGGPLVLFAVLQLAGWRPAITASNRVAEVVAGTASGLFGGLAGMFGPPMVVYLTAINTEKTEQVRIQGVVFAMGATVFGLAHAVSGLVRPDTLLFSAAITVPALLGQWAGLRLHDRVNQNLFRTLTLIVLLLCGLNLLRRAVAG
ncbi:MAG: sulfite exporter TauE/SafE family protein [Paracoccaceae bacterium]